MMNNILNDGLFTATWTAEAVRDFNNMPLMALIF